MALEICQRHTKTNGSHGPYQLSTNCLVGSPITWIGSENTVNAVSGIIRNIDVVGKFVFIVQNALVGDFRVTGGKGRLSSEGSETDDADGPDIDLER